MRPRSLAPPAPRRTIWRSRSERRPTRARRRGRERFPAKGVSESASEEGGTYLDANESDRAVERSLLALLDEVVVHLSREEHDALDFRVVGDGGVGEDGLEGSPLGELCERRGRSLFKIVSSPFEAGRKATDRQTEDPLGREDDEGLAVLANELAPQEVEVLCGGTDVDEMHVGDERRAVDGLVRELEEALDASTAEARSVKS